MKKIVKISAAIAAAASAVFGAYKLKQHINNK